MKIDGTGSIEQLEKDKKRGRCRKWRLWVRADGKNRSRRFNGTYKNAIKALESFKAELSSKVTNKESFASYAASWRDYRRDTGGYDSNTLANDKHRVTALTRVLGEYSMDSITPEVCRDALSRIKNGENASGKVLANSTMQGMYIALGQIMGQAEDDGRISSNPMRKVKIPKSDTLERVALSPDELSLFLNRVDGLPLDGRSMALYLMACLALRRAEACALMDADVHDGMAYVRYAVKESDGSIGKPKSAAGVRALPIPPRLDARISEWRAIREVNGYGDAKTLACDTKGGVLLPQNLWRWWAGNSTHNGVRDSLGCPGMVLHELRHSNLSMMARHLSPFDLQRYAGWSSLEPARIYIHESMESVISGVSEAWSVMA